MAPPPLFPSDHPTTFSAIVDRLLTSMGTRVDDSTGSVARLLAEAYAREMATFYAMLGHAHASGYLDTAEGAALDNVVALLGVSRARAGRLIGQIEAGRATPAADDLVIPAGTQVTGARGGGELLPVFETTAEAVLARGQTAVTVPIQELSYDAAVAKVTPVLNPGTLTLLLRPVPGIERVSNPAPLRRNSEDEGDAALRLRARGALREGEKGTLESIAAAVRAQGVRQVTVREPDDGPPGVVEVLVDDRDLTRDPAAVSRVEQAIRETKAAGVRVHVRYARTVYFQPQVEVEPAEAGLDDGGFNRLERELADALMQLGERLPAGEAVSRRRLEAVLFGHPGVRNLSEIRMTTYVDGAGAEARVREPAGLRDRGDGKGWRIDPLETAVFDRGVPPVISRLRPPVYRFSLVVLVEKTDRRPREDIQKGVRRALDAYAATLDRQDDARRAVVWADLDAALREHAGVAALGQASVTNDAGLGTDLGSGGSAIPLEHVARLVLGSVEITVKA